VDGKKTLFVGNLSGEVDEDSLCSLFAEVGFVSSAKIERAADGTSKGWGCALALALVLVSLTMGDIVYTIRTYYHSRIYEAHKCD
jgi:hypothetical protein